MFVRGLLLALAMLFSGLSMAAVDLNTASKEQLTSVKGIGPKKADAIIEYRKKNGSFKSVDELNNVSGFGEKSVAKMRGELTVGGGGAEKAAAKADKPQKADKPTKKGTAGGKQEQW